MYVTKLLTLDACPDDLLCTEEEDFDHLSSLDTTKANCPDRISAKMLKESAVSVYKLIDKAIQHIY